MTEKKHKNGCNILIMTFTSLEKYMYSKKCSKQLRHFPTRSRRYFRACWLRLLFAVLNMPTQQIVTKRLVYHSP